MLNKYVKKKYNQFLLIKSSIKCQTNYIYSIFQWCHGPANNRSDRRHMELLKHQFKTRQVQIMNMGKKVSTALRFLYKTKFFNIYSKLD